MNRKHKRCIVSALLAIPATLAVAVAVAQDEVPQRPFTETINVQLVNVEVWVTDGKGRPVSGLAADEFEVFEDGEPVAISHFSEVHEATPVPDSGEPVPAGEVEEGQREKVSAGHLVLYFDQLHLRPASRNRLIKDLREFLAAERVPPERVLILTQDRRLQTLATFGSSWEQLDNALERIAKTAPEGGRAESEKRLEIQRLQTTWNLAREYASQGARGAAGTSDAACDYFLPRAVPDVERFAGESRERISVTLDHLASVASFLAGVPGVKTLLYLSDALERSPGSDLMNFVNDLCPQQQSSPMFLISDELSRAFRQLTRHANANRVTIYSVQGLGLRSSFMTTAEQGAVDFRGARSFDLALRANERDGLNNLAAETGGRAIVNRNQFDRALANVAREMGNYYSLAYEPRHGGDGGEHRIEVRTRRGFDVRYRRGYRDKSRDRQMTERLQGAVYLGLVDNSLAVRLGAGDVRAAGEGRVILPLHVAVPAERLAFLPGNDATSAYLALQVSTRNTKTREGIYEQREYRVRPPAQGDYVDLLVELELPEGVHLIAVGVRDDVTQEASFVSTTLELRATPGTGANG